ncbi:hypothetical protein LSTR_LSTR015472 [Laodelphax striatellus]|uniref:M-phase-specific PLK1-interacting protein n=1 Tax=Laodelphax striatellus TaxID=195883 RepID=A0A482XRX7_LAOST|nr:hypothetical protein LSTR_LSTR015472 [Laodelphax striatellus]
MDDFKYNSPLRCMKSSTPTTTASNSKTGFSNPNFVNMKNQSRASPAPDFIPIGSSNSPQNSFPRRFPNSNSSFRSDRGFPSPNFTSSPNNNRSPYNRPAFNRGRNSDFGGGNRGNFQRNNYRPRMDQSRNEVDISQYFHSSMLDDPWAQLTAANSRAASEQTASTHDNDQ